MPHGLHIYKTAVDTAISKLIHFPFEKHHLPHWKCVLHCCAKYTSIVIPGQEYNRG